jgi:hypothetical protein
MTEPDRVLTLLAGGRPGVADQVPPDGLERRIRRVAELTDEFGRYDA